MGATWKKYDATYKKRVDFDLAKIPGKDSLNLCGCGSYRRSKLNSILVIRPHCGTQ